MKTNQVRTLSTQRLGDCLGTVSDEEVAEILDGLKRLFEYPVPSSAMCRRD